MSDDATEFRRGVIAWLVLLVIIVGILITHCHR